MQSYRYTPNVAVLQATEKDEMQDDTADGGRGGVKSLIICTTTSRYSKVDAFSRGGPNIDKEYGRLT